MKRTAKAKWARFSWEVFIFNNQNVSQSSFLTSYLSTQHQLISNLNPIAGAIFYGRSPHAIISSTPFGN